MSEVFEIEAKLRSDAGKGASRRLRREGQVPAVVYGARKDPVMVTIGHVDFLRHLELEAFYSHILSLKIDGKAEQVILKDLQRHPAKPFILHVDFLRVSAKEKLKTNVPLHFMGEDVAPGVKAGGVVSHLITDVEVACLPKDLPEYIEVDVSPMDIGDSIMLSGIVLPKGVELPALGADNEHDLPVVAVNTAHIESDEEDEVEPVAGEEEGAAE